MRGGAVVRADENRGGPRERDDADGVSRREGRDDDGGGGDGVFEPSRGGAEVESRRSGYGTRGGARVVVGVRRVAGSNSVGGGLGLDAAELAVDGEETLEVGEVAPANRAVGGSNPVGRVVRGSRAVEDALGGDAEDAASVARRARGEKAREGRGRGVGSGRTGGVRGGVRAAGRERRDHGVGVAAARPVLVEQGSERGTEEGVRADHPGTGPEVRVRDERRGFRSGSGRPDARTVGNLRAALDVIHGRQPPAGGHPAVAHLRSRPARARGCDVRARERRGDSDRES